MSADPAVREVMGLSARRIDRSGTGAPVDVREAQDGVEAIALAWRWRPDVVVADEITSRAGAFAVAKDLKGAVPPHPAKVVILLDRPQDRWLAAWSGADAWFDKPVNPFELADAVAGPPAAPEEEAQ